MDQAETRPERDSVPDENYTGDEIDNINFSGNPNCPDSIGIYLKNGKYIRVIPGIKVYPRTIESQLEINRGGWLKGPDIKKGSAV